MNNLVQNIGRFELWGEWTPELIDAISDLLRRYERLIPPWCEIVHVAQKTDQTCAECGVDFEYRRARLYFGGRFFSGTYEERRSHLLHEIAHIYEHHLHNIAYDLVGDICTNETVITLARKQLKEANEGVTTDITYLIKMLLGDEA